MRDTGWQAATNYVDGWWRELTGMGSGLDARLEVFDGGRYRVLQTGIVSDYSEQGTEGAKRDALHAAISWILRREADTLAALGDG